MYSHQNQLSLHREFWEAPKLAKRVLKINNNALDFSCKMVIYLGIFGHVLQLCITLSGKQHAQTGKY